MWEVTLNVNTNTNLIKDQNNASTQNLANHITIRYNTEHVLNNVYILTTTISVILYLHAVAFFPVNSTWLKEIKNNF